MAGSLLVLCALALLSAVSAVDRSKFRTCETAAFCRSHRGKSAEPELRIVTPSLRVDGSGVVTAEVSAAVPGAPPFELTLQAFATGAVRMRILEKGEFPPRWEVRAGKGGSPRLAWGRAPGAPPPPPHTHTTMPSLGCPGSALARS